MSDVYFNNVLVLKKQNCYIFYIDLFIQNLSFYVSKNRK